MSQLSVKGFFPLTKPFSWSQSKPHELPGHTNGVEVRTGASRSPCVVRHSQRLTGAWGTTVHITGTTLVQHTVDGEPHLLADGVPDVPLNSGDRIQCPQRSSREKTRILGEKPGATVQVEIKFLPGIRNAYLGLGVPLVIRDLGSVCPCQLLLMPYMRATAVKIRELLCRLHHYLRMRNSSLSSSRVPRLEMGADCNRRDSNSGQSRQATLRIL